MNDCGNAEIRDQLPDLVHERLDEAARMLVLAHLDGCIDCRDEVQLLRDVRLALGLGTPRVDVAYIVGALPRAAAPQAGRPIARRRPAWGDWRIAAAVTLLLAGGGSYALMQSADVPAPRDTVAAVAAVPTTNPAVGAETAAVAAVAPSARPRNDAAPAAEDHAGAYIGGSRLGDLDEGQLRTLLNEVTNMKPVLATEPEPVTIRVDAKVSGEGV